ncbi:MAG: E3 binding domain-containing protein [Chloroflexi bacterium OHK40]
MLPSLPGGAATVMRWLVREGEAVVGGAPLLIVLTERAEVLLPAPATGLLQAPLAVGARVAPGGLLARLGPAASVEGQRPTGKVEAAAPVRRPRATPLARRIALAHGVELASLAGSGSGNRIVAADVRRAIVAAWPAANGQPPAGARVPGNGQAFAPSPRALGGGVSIPGPLPIATATVELDAGAALERVRALRPAFARLGLPLDLGSCVVEAVAALLPAHTLLNARWSEDALLLRRRIHLAVAQTGEGGRLGWRLVRDAGDLTLRGVARALAGPEVADLAAATFAVVSLAGGVGWASASPPLPGTAAALSVAAPAMRVAVGGAGLARRPLGTLTLSYDARVFDHREAAAFLRVLRDRLEHVA